MIDEDVLNSIINNISECVDDIMWLKDHGPEYLENNELKLTLLDLRMILKFLGN